MEKVNLRQETKLFTHDDCDSVGWSNVLVTDTQVDWLMINPSVHCT